MPTLTYVGNKNAGDGNAALNVASGMVRLGASGVFTAAERGGNFGDICNTGFTAGICICRGTIRRLWPCN